MKHQRDEGASAQGQKVTVYFRSPNGRIRTERTYGKPSEVHAGWDGRRGAPLVVREGWHGEG